MLDSTHQKRNLSEYEGYLEVDQALVDALYEGKTSQFIETQVKFEDGRTGSVSATLKIDDAKTFAPVKAAA